MSLKTVPSAAQPWEERAPSRPIRGRGHRRHGPTILIVVAVATLSSLPASEAHSPSLQWSWQGNGNAPCTAHYSSSHTGSPLTANANTASQLSACTTVRAAIHYKKNGTVHTKTNTDYNGWDYFLAQVQEPGIQTLFYSFHSSRNNGNPAQWDGRYIWH